MGRFFKTIIKIFLVVGVCIFFSCKKDYDPNKPTTFCTTIDGYTIVNNAPYDTILLKKEIEKYIFSTYNADSVRKNDIRLSILRGDESLTCNFKEGEPYKVIPLDVWDDVQDIRNHINKRVMRISIYCREDNTGAYAYSLFYPTGYDWPNKRKHTYFKNVDSFFQAKRKEYNIQ